MNFEVVGGCCSSCHVVDGSLLFFFCQLGFHRCVECPARAYFRVRVLSSSATTSPAMPPVDATAAADVLSRYMHVLSHGGMWLCVMVPVGALQVDGVVVVHTRTHTKV